MRLGVIVFICSPLEGHTAFSINLDPGHILNPIPLLERVGIQEGTLCAMSYALGIWSWGTFSRVTFPRGVQTPLFSAIPSLQFKCGSFLADFTNGQSLMK